MTIGVIRADASALINSLRLLDEENKLSSDEENKLGWNDPLPPPDPNRPPGVPPEEQPEELEDLTPMKGRADKWTGPDS